jgi:ribosome maturation factor RimP
VCIQLPCGALLLLLLLLLQGLEAELGAEAAGEVSFEVSTPGAERTLILPQDLLRFKV